MDIDRLFESKNYILFTDSWHPTLNPSSRMPVHHLRYNSLFTGRTGILTEVPRRYGGSTLREMLFSAQGLAVRDLNTPAEWFPWWRSCDDPQVLGCLGDIISAGETSGDCYAKSAYRDFHRRYFEIISQDASLTVGEAVNMVNNSICREMTGIIAPELVSYTKHNNYKLLVSSYEQIKNDICGILDRLLKCLERDLFGMLAIITDYEGRSWRVRYSQYRGYFIAVNTQDDGDRLRLSSEMLLSLIKEKKLLPGSVLSCIIESIVACQGDRVFHYGNTYGYFELIAEVMGLSHEERDRIGYFRDNSDSWNYAELIKADGTGYPIHLLDTWKRNSIHGELRELIEESCNSRRTIMITLRKDNSLESAIFNRGA